MYNPVEKGRVKKKHCTPIKFLCGSKGRAVFCVQIHAHNVSDSVHCTTFETLCVRRPSSNEIIQYVIESHVDHDIARNLQQVQSTKGLYLAIVIYFIYGMPHVLMQTSFIAVMFHIALFIGFCTCWGILYVIACGHKMQHANRVIYMVSYSDAPEIFIC